MTSPVCNRVEPDLSAESGSHTKESMHKYGDRAMVLFVVIVLVGIASTLSIRATDVETRLDNTANVRIK